MRRRWFRMCMILMLAMLLTSPVMLAEGGLNSALVMTSATPAPASTEMPSATLYAPASTGTAAATQHAPTPSPTADPTPAPVRFEAEGLSITLPQGFELLETDTLEGFEAALEGDYPGLAQTLFAARDAEADAAVVAIAVATQEDCPDAAREAADALIGDQDAATEVKFGENRGASFACAIGDQAYRLCFFSDGERLIIIGASGLDEAQCEAMLSGMELAGPAASPLATPASH